MSRSPTVRTRVFGPGVVRFGCAFWLISKSKLVVPDWDTLDHPRYRKMLPFAACSLAT
jgi:hypothetical protein